jgi:RimJ/RimL family protein N-acetyltransferase
MEHDIFLETARLYLRRFTTEDAPLLCVLDSDPEVMRYISKGEPTPLSRIRSRILPAWLGYYEAHEHLGFWAAHERDTHLFIGWFHLRPTRLHPARLPPEDMELGYRLRRNAWGRGYATEGSRALLDNAFTRWDIGRVIATTLVENRASQRVMAKCGLRFEDTFTYPADLLPGWTAEERCAVRYARDRADYLAQRGTASS